jgi:hypothetical protein
MPEFPSQTENRRFLIIETIKENQEIVTDVLIALREGDYRHARVLTDSLYGTDRYALMHPEGILTGEQRRQIYES